MSSLKKMVLLIVILSLGSLLISACSSSGGSGYSRSSMHYGYRGYRGHPWGYGYDGVYIPGGGGIDPGWGGGGPTAVQLPEMGMPDMGGMDFDF